MKKISVFPLVFSIILCFYSCSNVNEDYFYQINSLIKDIEFHIAKVEENRIIFYDLQNEEIKEIGFKQNQESATIDYIRKEGPLIFFVTNSSVDDEQGVVFINDDSNNLLDGISTMHRLGGNSYRYNTRN